MRKKVLVFPCGSEIGLEILQSLKYSTHCELIGGSTVDDHGQFAYRNYVGGLPHVDDDAFVPAINRLIRDQGIQFIFPAHDSAVVKLAQAKQTGNLDCDVITSPSRTCEIARSKLKTYQRLASVVPTPQVLDLEALSDRDFPIFMKPQVGQGSKGSLLVQSVVEAKSASRLDSSLLALEYLPGPEYTIDCFTDRKGRLLFSEGRERQRIMNGISVRAVRRFDDRFRSIAGAINEALDFRGVWFFQVKERTNGDLVLMEFAPRVAGTMGLTRCRGVNLPLLSLFDALELDVSVFENPGDVVIDRALGNLYQHSLHYEHVYLDFDDLVVFEGQVNPAVIAFVYQCLNRGVQLHLLSRHSADLNVSLREYKLDHLFVDAVRIGRDDQKHTFITERSAIFIDDSFAERQAVHDALGIPVFDAHMIESLMDPL
jgi:hypothetical protein